jgi:DNA-directed RNA polymerase specialized sigma24 family protein
MSPPEPHEERTHAPAWSPKTETRENFKALLRRRSALMPSEILLFRQLYTEMYDTYLDTLLCVVRCRGAQGADEMDLAHDALAKFWGETVAEGFPESIQAKLLSLASGAARNHVRRKGRNPAKHDLPTSSKETPGSFPKPERQMFLSDEVRPLFHRLSPEHQAIIDAVVLRDLTVADAARELGLPRTTAQSRLTAALALLLEWAEELLSPSERRL